jgi:uncharacterized damage-inducible protein DinB
MTLTTIRSAFASWPTYNARLRDTVAGLTVEQLAIQPAPDRWPLWATVGHLACQRVSWLCGFAGEPGAEETPFPDALHTCPGDEDLEHVLGPADLAAALDATFRVVEGVLDGWTAESLDEVIRRTFGAEEWAHTRGWVVERVFAHDVYHVAELNEALARAGLPLVNLWE